MTPRSARFAHVPRFAFALAVLAGVSTMAVTQSGAQALAGHDSNAPVHTEADHIELQDKQNRAILSGNVVVTQTDLRMTSARTVVNYSQGNSVQLQRITASGGVKVTRGDEVATGDTAIYDFNKRIITMIGNATIKRANGDTLHGGRFIIDLKSGVSQATGGRVSGTFSVPKQSN